MGPRICLCLPVTGGGMMTPGCCLGKVEGQSIPARTARHASPVYEGERGGVMREGKGRPLWIISGRWRTPGSTGASGTSCWTCGADSWVYIELFGKSKLEWFQTFLELPQASRPIRPGAVSSSASWPGPRRCPT